MRHFIIGALIALLFTIPASAALVGADVTLTGFIQNIGVTNTSATATITSITYSLGPAGDGIATWDTDTAGGVASDFLSDPQWFQTVTWSGLSIGPGSSWSTGPLDIDLIVTLLPLNVTGGTLDTTGSSLVGAFFLVNFDSGQTAGANLVQQAWATDQNLTLTEGWGAQIPEPSTLLATAGGLLLVGLLRARRRA
ncbi:MAG: PEP-CTERM sorting domain-containing protein [Acidobacteria bacterium]|nr:PEP-CTERM sorting domain-containing protein [Acidobacteriota bacterium]